MPLFEMGHVTAAAHPRRGPRERTSSVMRCRDYQKRIESESRFREREVGCDDEGVGFTFRHVID